MKSCKFCMVDIPQKARICSNCHRPQSGLARLKASLGSSAAALVAVISFLYGANQKLANFDTTRTLAKVEENLNTAEKNLGTAKKIIIQGSDLTRRILKDVAPRTAAYGATAGSPGGNGYGSPAPSAAPSAGDSTQSKLDSLDEKIAQQLGQPETDWTELARLQQQRQELQQQLLGSY